MRRRVLGGAAGRVGCLRGQPAGRRQGGTLPLSRAAMIWLVIDRRMSSWVGMAAHLPLVSAKTEERRMRHATEVVSQNVRQGQCDGWSAVGR